MLRTINMQTAQAASLRSSSSQVAIFNSAKTEMLICDMLQWNAPDGVGVIVALIIPCAHCGYPIISRPDQVSLKYSADGKLTLMQKLSCPARWRDIDSDGMVNTDEEGNPIIRRCNWQAKGIENNILKEIKN